MSRDIAVSFVMGNEIVAPIPPVADINIFHLQFPFPWRNIGAWSFNRLELYDSIVVNSAFTAQVDNAPAGRGRDKASRRPSPSSARRFARGDAAAFRDEIAARQAAFGDGWAVLCWRPFEAPRHFPADRQGGAAGERRGDHRDQHRRRASGRLARELYATICQEAEAMGGVDVIVDASAEEMAATLARADIYVHSAGYGVLEEVSPESMEHFGMSIIEALQADCVPGRRRCRRAAGDRRQGEMRLHLRLDRRGRGPDPATCRRAAAPSGARRARHGVDRGALGACLRPQFAAHRGVAGACRRRRQA